MNRVSRRAILLWGTEYFFGWLVVFLVSWGLVAWFGAAPWGPLPDHVMHRMSWLPKAVALAGMVTVLVAPCWRYRVHRWEVGHDVVYTRTGWFTRHWLLVPVSRVQTVDAEQGLIERVLGLATLRVTTASHAGSSKVSGLPVRTAAGLAAELARRAHDLRDDAT